MKRIPIYPALVAIFPVLGVYAANIALFPLSYLWRPLMIALAAGLALQIVFTLLWRNAQRGAFSAAIVAAWFWVFSWVTQPMVPVLEGLTVPAFWVVGALLALAGRWGPRPLVLNLLVGFATLASAGQIAWMAAFPPAPRAEALARQQATPLPPGPRPDIFVVLLDGFGSPSRLREKIGVDLQWFVKELRQRGFQVPDQAHSNYVQTQLSVSSLLGMDFVQDLVATSPDAGDRRVLDPILRQPPVATRLQASGYRYLAVGTGFTGLDFGIYQLPLGDSGAMSLFESTLLQRTPFAGQGEATESQYIVHHRRIEGAFRQLEALGRPTGTPRLVFAHILAPHPPFTFDAEGRFVRPRGPFGYFDGSDYMGFVGNAESYKAGYSGQVQFVARRLLQLADSLAAANPKRPPVVLFLGDHGSKVGLHQNDLERTDVAEAFPILYALRTPPDVPITLGETATPVNSFRRIFSALGATDLPLREDNSWYSPYEFPFRFTPVTIP